MNYLGHPHKTSNHISTLPLLFDFENQQALAVEGSHDLTVTWTTVQDIAGVVARAVEHKGEWPAIGGISGSRVTVGQMLQLGEALGKFQDTMLEREIKRIICSRPAADELCRQAIHGDVDQQARARD